MAFSAVALFFRERAKALLLMLVRVPVLNVPSLYQVKALGIYWMVCDR